MVYLLRQQSFQGIDAPGLAVGTLATALGQSLLDTAAATAALQATPTLLILDNLEAVPADTAAELLTAAKAWSEAGESRVLVTTRQPNLEHPDWPAQGSKRCRYLDVKGLRADDALDWFQALMALPPEPTVTLPDRDALKTLFARVEFHPLSIGVVAEVLKTRRIAEVGERLEAILKTETEPLIASLNLSIERLAPELRAQLPKLGVFQGGALEWPVKQVTQLSEEQWAALRLRLEQTGLIRAEALPGYALPYSLPYLRFHPTLAPALWAHLDAEERAELTARHRDTYCDLSGILRAKAPKSAGRVRAIAKAELPNLMGAVHAAIDTAVPKAAEFADNVGFFLENSGLVRDRAALVDRAQAVAGGVGSDAWYLVRSQKGDQLFAAGRFAEAERVFAEVLTAVGEAPSFERCLTLANQAKCFLGQSRPDQAETLQYHALAEIERLEQTPDVRQLKQRLLSYRGYSQWRRGNLTGAQETYKAALAIARELGNDRNAAADLGQLGAIALDRGELDEAERRHKEALTTFQALGEPAPVSATWHQLGLVYQRQKRWGEAERAYRESAQIDEQRGYQQEAAKSWHQLARVMEDQSKPDEAEQWYGKALAAFRAAGDRAGESGTLNNLAYLLRGRPGRLADARRYAERALPIQQTLDPGAIKIWTTYAILAEIADVEGRADDARAFRRQERQSFGGAPASRETLRQYAPLISAVAAAVADPAQRPAVETHLHSMVGRGLGKLVGALRRLLDGDRDEDALTEGLHWEYSLIVATALRALGDPAVLTGLQGNATPKDHADA